MSAATARIKKSVIAAIELNGGIAGGVRTTGKQKSSVGNWHNVNDESLPTLGDAFALDQVALIDGHRPPILSALAAELGHVAIRLPDAGMGGDALTGALIEASAEFGDVAAELRDATRDGKVTPKERERIVAQVDEALAALSRMRALAAAPAVVDLKEGRGK